MIKIPLSLQSGQNHNFWAKVEADTLSIHPVGRRCHITEHMDSSDLPSFNPIIHGVGGQFDHRFTFYSISPRL